MTLRYSTDVVIFGGGVAGLWLLNRLRQRGYAVILLEANALGGGQTMASQGIIHGGLKYSLAGKSSAAADAVATMPARWRSCLRSGPGEIDLSRVKVLSDRYYMWSDGSPVSRLKTFLGSRSLRGRVQVVERADYPAFFAGGQVPGTLYVLPDFVLDAGSLVRELAEPWRESIFAVDADTLRFARGADGNLDAVQLQTQHGPLEIAARRLIFSAGAGNRSLLAKAGLDTVQTQSRPLQMVYLKKKHLPPVYVHCIGNDFSLTPRLTLSSHRDAHGAVVWYLGGELAESGVGKDPRSQIEAARALIAELFPWVDLGGAEWHCLAIARAEAGSDNLWRPHGACVVAEKNVLAAWPTKLALAPVLADKVIERLQQDDVLPGAAPLEQGLERHLGRPALAPACWD